MKCAFRSFPLKILGLIASNPENFFFHLVPSLFRGFLLKMKYIFRPNIQIGWFIRQNCNVSINGPGKVLIGNHVQFSVNNLEGVGIITTNKKARVCIGEDSNLGGVKILCSHSVSIGSHCIFAKSFISDIDYLDDHPSLARSIVIKDYCWVSSGSGLLKGSVLGRGSTLGICSVLSNKVIKNSFLVIGRPARAVLKIKRSGSLKGQKGL